MATKKELETENTGLKAEIKQLKSEIKNGLMMPLPKDKNDDDEINPEDFKPNP